jgi:26S proteasome regulatory subunit N13
VRQLLASLNTEGGSPAAARSGATGARSRPPPENVFTTLSDLLGPETSVPVVAAAPDALLDALLAQLPAAALAPELRHDPPSSSSAAAATPSSEPATAEALATMSAAQKRAVLARVLHGPQFAQALAALTAALRDGGLPTVSGALGIRVENGGYRGNMPLGGGDAVEAFVRGVERTVESEDEDKKKGDKEGEGDTMDTS